MLTSTFFLSILKHNRDHELKRDNVEFSPLMVKDISLNPNVKIIWSKRKDHYDYVFLYGGEVLTLTELSEVEEDFENPMMTRVDHYNAICDLISQGRSLLLSWETPRKEAIKRKWNSFAREWKVEMALMAASDET